jgi:hypothetical protein
MAGAQRAGALRGGGGGGGAHLVEGARLCGLEEGAQAVELRVCVVALAPLPLPAARRGSVRPRCAHVRTSGVGARGIRHRFLSSMVSMSAEHDSPASCSLSTLPKSWLKERRRSPESECACFMRRSGVMPAPPCDIWSSTEPESSSLVRS